MLEVGSRFSTEYLEGSLSLYSGKKRDSIFRDAENFMQDHGKTNAYRL